MQNSRWINLAAEASLLLLLHEHCVPLKPPLQLYFKVKKFNPIRFVQFYTFSEGIAVSGARTTGFHGSLHSGVVLDSYPVEIWI